MEIHWETESQKVQFYFISVSSSFSGGFFNLKSATATSSVLLTFWHIIIRSWHASFNTSRAGAPIKFQARTKNHQIHTMCIASISLLKCIATLILNSRQESMAKSFIQVTSNIYSQHVLHSVIARKLFTKYFSFDEWQPFHRGKRCRHFQSFNPKHVGLEKFM